MYFVPFSARKIDFHIRFKYLVSEYLQTEKQVELRSAAHQWPSMSSISELPNTVLS